MEHDPSQSVPPDPVGAPPYSTGHSRHMRAILADARRRLGLSAQDVADRIAALMLKDSFTGQSVRQYERFERHPPIDVYAAWARAVGYILKIDLDPIDSGRSMVLIHSPDAATLARELDAAPPEVVQAVSALFEHDLSGLVLSLAALSPGDRATIEAIVKKFSA